MNKINLQSGRSMIEMLGVLAIIGVLSVGGIMGYSKAMHRYRVNKTIEQITYIAGNIRTTFANQGDYSGLACDTGASGCTGTTPCQGNNGYDGCPIILKAKIYPDEMLTLDADGKKIMSINNPFGYTTGMYSEGKSTASDQKAFRIMTYLPKDDVETCIELAIHDWSSINVKAIDPSACERLYLKTPIDLDTAATYCSAVVTCSSDRWMYFYFDIDLSSSRWNSISWKN